MFWTANGCLTSVLLKITIFFLFFLFSSFSDTKDWKAEQKLICQAFIHWSKYKTNTLPINIFFVNFALQILSHPKQTWLVHLPRKYWATNQATEFTSSCIFFFFLQNWFYRNYGESDHLLKLELVETKKIEITPPSNIFLLTFSQTPAENNKWLIPFGR